MYVYLLLNYVDGLELDFFLTHQLFISVSELCNAIMQKYPLLTITFLSLETR